MSPLSGNSIGGFNHVRINHPLGERPVRSVRSPQAGNGGYLGFTRRPCQHSRLGERPAWNTSPAVYPAAVYTDEIVNGRRVAVIERILLWSITLRFGPPYALGAFLKEIM